VDLNEVVERSLLLVRHHLEISGVKLHCELIHGDSRIVADGGQLQQALIALLVNAVEAMRGLDGEERELTVRLQGDPDEVHIEIADTGVDAISIGALTHSSPALDISLRLWPA